MHANELIVGLLIACLILMAVARHTRIAPPIALVVGGLALGFVPWLPAPALDPELVLLAFLPPVLFWEATLASWREVKRNLLPIALLSVGLVLATMAAVAVVAHALGMPWPIAFVLGAVVSPTDPVALLSITERLPLPQRLVDVLVGESLVNDATALLAFRFAVAAMAAGSFQAASAPGRFAWVVAGALAAGAGSAWLILRLRRLLAWDALHENLMMFLAPFLAYLVAEAAGASGVLAVVVSGLYIGRRIPQFLSSQARLEGVVIWEMIVFVLNGLLFVLVGLQLHAILQQPMALSPGALVGVGVAVTAAAIATRLAYVFGVVWLPWRLSGRLPLGEALPPTSHVWLLGWTGMRGGVSLAVALAVPERLASGAPFPGRHEIVLVTYVVILGTLLAQGLTLPWLIRRLGVKGDAALAREEAAARLEVTHAALRRLDALALEREIPADLYHGLHARYVERADRLLARRSVAPDSRLESRERLLAELRGEVLEAERAALLGLRDRGVIGDDVLHRLQAELDLEVVLLEGAAPRG